jgi:S1/P1 Nuclease
LSVRPPIAGSNIPTTPQAAAPWRRTHPQPTWRVWARASEGGCRGGYGWGREGHRIVADVAQERLTEVTKRNVQSLIGNNTLASVANWADQIRSERDETYNWHFVDIPASLLAPPVSPAFETDRFL